MMTGLMVLAIIILGPLALVAVSVLLYRVLGLWVGVARWVAWHL